MLECASPRDDCDDEVAPEKAEDEGAGEEEVEDGDPHPPHHQGEAQEAHASWGD